MKKFKTKFFTSFITTLLFSLCFITSFAFADTKATSYTINAVFNENTQLLTAKETVSFTNSYKKELKDLVFHLYPDSYNNPENLPAIGFTPEKLSREQLGDITISKVLINDKEVPYTQDKQILKIKPSTSIKPDEEVKVYIEFTLKLPYGNNRLGYYNDIYSFTNWHPILSIYDAKTNTWDENPFHPIGESNYSEVADYNVTIETSKNMVIASTGVDNSIDFKDGRKVVNIKAEKVRDFVFIASPKFKVISKTVDGIKVNSFYYNETDPKVSKKQASKLLDVTIDSIKFFSNTFGKYPYREFDIVETHLSGGAMEYPQLIQMGNYSFDPDKDYSLSYNHLPFEIEATVHEVGHQWWYVVVGNNEFKESFLDESLTTFSTAYYFEKNYGKYNPQSAYMQFRINYYPGGFSSIPFNSSVDNFKSWSDYGMTIYRNAPVVFEDLRQRVGEEKFVATLKEYFDEFKFKNADINGLLNVIGKVNGKETENAIKNAVNSDKYFPENISISDEERNKAYQEIEKSRIIASEKLYGLSMDSIIAKGILGEKVYAVKPSNLSKNEALDLDNFLQMLQSSYKSQYGFDIIIKEDKDITSEELKNGNLLILGNPWNNKAFNSISSELPVSITKYSLTMKDLSIYSNNISGQFVAENPNNKSKVVLTLFWTKELNFKAFNYYSNYYEEAPNQFNINIDDKKNFSGRY